MLFTCDDLSDGWLKGEPVQVQAHGDKYLIRQGESVCVASAMGNHDRLPQQVQRGLTLWILRNHQDKVLQVQWLDLVEQIHLDMTISVDEAIAEQLASKGEIPTPAEVPSAVKWLIDRFISADVSTASTVGLGQVFLGRFENSSDDGFVIFGAGWRGSVKRDKGALKLISLTRLRGASGRLAMAVGQIGFQDASVNVRLQSTEQRALLDAALRDNGSYLRLWQEYGALEWEQARDCARELGSLHFNQANLIEGELWAWSLKVDPEQIKSFSGRWKTLGLASNTQVELGEREYKAIRILLRISKPCKFSS